jgi:hypothetical protein
MRPRHFAPDKPLLLIFVGGRQRSELSATVIGLCDVGRPDVPLGLAALLARLISLSSFNAAVPL